MPKTVFISHAGADSSAALEIATKLNREGLEVEIDREKLRAGDSFLSFMEEALAGSDYCLLLWSKAASEGKYVQVEWEAALYKTIEESRRFLLIGRLHDFPVPALLGPRLRVELFPDSDAGLAELIALVEDDELAERESGRQVGRAARPPAEDAEGSEVYVTSELFGLTLPLRWDLRIPCGVHLDQLADSLGLPRKHDHEGVMGVRYEYRLVHDEVTLTRERSLADQGVGSGAVLWLQVDMQPFAAGKAVDGELSGARFRGQPDLISDGRRALLDAVSSAGLGIRDTSRR